MYPVASTRHYLSGPNKVNIPRLKKSTAIRRKHAAIATEAASKKRKVESAAAVDSPPSTSVSCRTSPSLATDERPQTSAEKRKSYVLVEAEKPEAPERRRIIILQETVEGIVQNMLCSNCASDKVTVKFTHHQIDSYVLIKCQCGHMIQDTHKDSVKQAWEANTS